MRAGLLACGSCLSVVKIKYADRTLAAMACNRAGRNGFDNFAELEVFVDFLADFLYDFGIGGGVSNENARGVGVGEHLENVIHVFGCKSDGVAAVLFADGDFTVHENKRRFKFERGREEGRETGASAAFIQVVHRIHEERRFDSGNAARHFS